jgi:hypothetical protein
LEASGAYGFRLKDLRSPSLLSPVPSSWPEITVRIGPPADDPSEVILDDDRISLPLIDDGHLTAERASREAVYRLQSPIPDEDLIHPYLSVAAGTFAWWMGRESFHAGGFVADGLAWGVLGHKEQGKSSLLTWLSLRGWQIIADDLLITDGNTVFAGPRSIDLREASAEHFSQVVSTKVRGDERDRIHLGPVDPEVPLAGWIFLDWGDEIRCNALPVTERLAELSLFRGFKHLPKDPGGFLHIGARPAFRLTRPKRWDVMSDAVAVLMDAVSKAG